MDSRAVTAADFVTFEPWTAISLIAQGVSGRLRGVSPLKSRLNVNAATAARYFRRGDVARRQPIRNWPMVISLVSLRRFGIMPGRADPRCSFFICRSRNCRMHGSTRALLQEWMFSWLQEFRMNIYERPSRPGRGGWNFSLSLSLPYSSSFPRSHLFLVFFSPPFAVSFRFFPSLRVPFVR